MDDAHAPLDTVPTKVATEERRGVRSFGVAPFFFMVGGGVVTAVVAGISVVYEMPWISWGVLALGALLQGYLAFRHARGTWIHPAFAFFLGVILTGVGAFLALSITSTFTRGRQLRSLGRVKLPRVGRTRAWSALSASRFDDLRVSHDDVDAPDEALAQQWRENGRTEHASVAAFARVTLDLMTVGAPPALLRAAQEDALDEIRHTELCFALARALDGQDLGPADFPAAGSTRPLPVGRLLALATLATTSLIDGALHEGMSAAILARLARRCDDPRISATLREIAADEGRHAAHGWDVVTWCAVEGGEPVLAALRGAVAVLPERTRPHLPEAAANGAWERHGIHGEALEQEEFVRARRLLLRRVTRLAAAVSALPQSAGDGVPPWAQRPAMAQ